MNNSSIRVSLNEDFNKEEVEQRYKTEEARLIRIIEAIQGLTRSKEWSTLKTEVFENLATVLEKDIKTEARKEDPEPKKLNRLSGELKWAEKFADLDKLENFYRLQLLNVRKQSNGKESE